MFIFLLPFLFGCQHRLSPVLKKYMGKEVPILQCLDSSIYDKYETDSLDFYLIVHWVDSTNCTKCQLRLSSWMHLLTDMNKLPRKEIKLLFLTSSHNLDKIQKEIVHTPFIVREMDSSLLTTIKGMLEYRELNTFIIDKRQIIRMIGNPIRSQTMRDNYFRVILNQNDSPHRIDRK